MSRNPSIKDVLAVVDGTPSSLTAVDQAIAYAGLHGAALTIIVVTENLALAAVADPMAFAEVLTVSDAERKEHVAAVRERAKGAPVPVEVRGLFEAPAQLPGLAKAEGQYADIAIIPGAGRWQSDGLRRRVTEALMFAGVPILVAPASWNPAPVIRAALGWNASLEAFRAARVLLDLVEPDATIDVVVVDSLDGHASGQPAPGSQIAGHLARHGHKAAVHAIGSADHGTSGALQLFACDQGADLLVIGGYGRSRAMEFILGGVTRELIARQQLPIVFVH
jgi:nucleotide-binding universal stress UspA family protein